MKPVGTDQTVAARATLMRHAINEFQDRPIDALEIGTWMGIGSTTIWLEQLHPGSTLTLIDPWQPYHSRADIEDTGFDYRGMDAQATDARACQRGEMPARPSHRWFPRHCGLDITVDCSEGDGQAHVVTGSDK